MIKLTLASLCGALALGLSGCATLNRLDPNTALKAGLDHIEGCDRTYTGGTGLGAAFTFNITCKARAPTVASPPPETAPSPQAATGL